MFNELTAQDIEKMEAELSDRIVNQRHLLLEEVKRCREFGDLSENFEYKEAKRAKNRNESRIRYLQRMIRTATVIEDKSDADTVGLYDKVGVYIPEDDVVEYYRVVTTVRIDLDAGFISKESPMGKQLLGKRIGDKFTVQVNDSYSYEAEIRSIEKGEDDGTAGLMQY